jgi:hypothetical protein
MVLPFHQIEGYPPKTAAVYLTNKLFRETILVPQRLQQLDLSPFFLTIFSSNQGT